MQTIINWIKSNWLLIILIICFAGSVGGLFSFGFKLSEAESLVEGLTGDIESANRLTVNLSNYIIGLTVDNIELAKDNRKLIENYTKLERINSELTKSVESSRAKIREALTITDGAKHQ